MSNGYLVAAEPDIAAARELGDGFELEVLEVAALGGDAAAEALASAANVGVLLSDAAARDPGYVDLLRRLAARLPRAQLIVVDANAPAQFGFLPQDWPAMPLDEALRRANELKRRRQPPPPEAAPEPPRHAAPIDQPPESAPQEQEQQQQQQDEASASEPEEMAAPEPEIASTTETEIAPPLSTEEPPPADDERERGVDIEAAHDEAVAAAASEDTGPTNDESVPEPSSDQPAPSAAAPAPFQATDDLQAPPLESAPAPPLKAEPPVEDSKIEPPTSPQAAPASVAPDNDVSAGAARNPSRSQSGVSRALAADASAFAPKKLRRETPELVRVVIYQPHQLKAVLKAAKKIDPRAEAAPQGMRVGDIAVGESVGVALEVRGAACDGAVQRRVWNGEPIDFSFTVEVEAGVKQAVILARVFVGDAQVGVIGFTRPISGGGKKPASSERLKLRRHRRVFLSYSSQDRDTVAAIATAYRAAGISLFWDRSSLASGEEWSPRLRVEIDKADLFHLCWSKAASKSQWVVTEAEHALRRRRRSNGKQPDITVQMLDGPPWAPHPISLDSINFDDFVRAAAVGYARGDGGDPA
jgi:hypothetical protein